MVSSELLGEGADDIAIGDHDRLNLKDLLDICKPPPPFPPPTLLPHHPLHYPTYLVFLGSTTKAE